MFNKTTAMLNEDRSAYHLQAHPDDIAPLVFLVGDPDRTHQVARHFDKVEIEKQHREFSLKTGFLKNRHVSVLSTGIGTDNIDIVMNELDLLVNLHPKTGASNSPLKQLKIIRLGTCGAIDAKVPVDSLIISDYAVAFDDLMFFYQQTAPSENGLLNSLKQHFSQAPWARNLYLTKGEKQLITQFEHLGYKGITLTASGFYGPQGRSLRLPLSQPSLIKLATSFSSPAGTLLNLEMETAGIYGLGNLLGHHCCSISTVVANRITGERTNNLEQAIERMITSVLNILNPV